MKKILFAIGYSAQIGGAQKVFLSTINEMSFMDCEIHVILPDASLMPSIVSKNIKIHYINFSSLISLIKIYKIIKQNNFDIINTYLTKSSLIISFVNILFRIPIYCTLLNEIIHVKLNFFQKIYYPLFYYFLSKICNGFIVNSNYNKDNIVKLLNLNPDFIKVIYSGIDNKFFRFTSNTSGVFNNSKLIIGYVGRLSQEKGPLYLLQALNQLNDINYECIIVGDGPLIEDLKHFSKVNNLFEKISFTGYHPDPINLMSMMDIIVVPSLNETFGITIIESFALKKIVVASDIGGIKEIIKNGINGFLFTPMSSIELSEIVRNIYIGKLKTTEMGNIAMNFAMNNFTSEIMAHKTYNFLLNSCDK